MNHEATVSARLRSDLLDAMYKRFPLALSIDQLEDAVKVAYLTRDSYWLISSIRVELSTLNQRGLIRPSAKGYLLTDKGRRDRQQVAQLLGNTETTPKPDPA